MKRTIVTVLGLALITGCGTDAASPLGGGSADAVVDGGAKDYDHLCAASLAGTSVSKTGACPSGKTCQVAADCDDGNPCTTDSCTLGKCANDKQSACCVMGKAGECPDNQFCKASTQWHCIGAGTCEAKPVTCGLIHKPVCGCDGKTYSNECMAWGAGQNAQSQGNCP